MKILFTCQAGIQTPPHLMRTMMAVLVYTGVQYTIKHGELVDIMKALRGQANPNDAFLCQASTGNNIFSQDGTEHPTKTVLIQNLEQLTQFINEQGLWNIVT